MKKVLITGITGQDGSYMAEYCLNLGHRVFGMVRRTAQIHDGNFKHLYGNPNFIRVYGDISDSHSIESLVKEIQPDYFINFAAQSFVGVSWKIPEETFMVGAVGVLKCLEAIRKHAQSCRFYNAGSSEQFGDVNYSPQDEYHPFRPRSPYGAAKCAAHHLVKVYRESYGLYAVQGLLFNHESERRGEEFVTRKITKGLARIANAIVNKESFVPIELGNIYAKRDWSHAEDFVDGVWKMLNQDTIRNLRQDWDDLPESINESWNSYMTRNLKEYVLASGETHTIKEFATLAAQHAGLEVVWVDDGMNEKLVLANYLSDLSNIKSQVIIQINPEFYRPAEVELLLGNSTAARQELGWAPKISLDILAKRMIESDLYELGVRPKSASYASQTQTGQETQGA